MNGAIWGAERQKRSKNDRVRPGGRVCNMCDAFCPSNVQLVQINLQTFLSFIRLAHRLREHGATAEALRSRITIELQRNRYRGVAIANDGDRWRTKSAETNIRYCR